MSDTTYNLDEIVDFKSSIPVGDYDVKLTNVEMGTTQKGDPKLAATFEIISGEYTGENLTKMYFLVNFKTKRGATGNMGISEFRKDAQAVGALSQVPRQFSASEFRKIYASVFGKKKMTLSKSLQKDTKGATNEDGSPKMWPRYSVTGLAQSAQTVSSVDPLAELGL